LACRKLLIIDLTITNDNSFPLQNVVVSCQINGDPGEAAGQSRRGDPSAGSPRNTVVRGLEFSIMHDKADGGPCKVEAAQRAQ